MSKRPAFTTVDRAGTAEPPGVRKHEFRAMGTQVKLIAPDPDGTRKPKRVRVAFEVAARKVERVFERQEARFTRFKNESELSQVNVRAGEWTRVSPKFAEMVRLSLQAAEASGGLFDPTILPALLAVGYDRDFDDLVAGARLELNPPQPCGRWPEIRLEDDMLFVPEGVSVDFGGIAKGWTVDLAAERAAVLLPWAIVDAGGDLRLAGDEIPQGGMDVGVEDPLYPDDEVLRLRLEHGALATSSVTRRSWGPGLHHLIDPRTSLPAETGVLQATVWAPTCAEAEVRSKWALLAGEEILSRLSAVLVMEDGRIVLNMDALDTPDGQHTAGEEDGSA